MKDINEYIWDGIIAREGKTFTTQKGKAFVYQMKRDKAGEMQGAIEIEGKFGAITRATILLGGHQAIEVQKAKGCVKSYRKIGTFGAEFLYPLFLDMGLICEVPGQTPRRTDREEDPVAIADEEVQASEIPGTTKIRRCRNCGYQTEEDFDFCPKCGEHF